MSLFFFFKSCAEPVEYIVDLLFAISWQISLTLY